MKKFIILADGLTAEQQNAITRFIQDRGWGFWHWHTNTWLLAGLPDDWTPRRLQVDLEESLKLQTSMIIMSISDPITFFGRAPEEAWPWLQQRWGTPR